MKRKPIWKQHKPKGYVWQDGKLVPRAHVHSAVKFQNAYARLLPGKPGEKSK